MKISFIAILLVLLASCKSPEARYPVTQNSGTYISESIERNKKIVASEEEFIEDLIQEDSTREYHASNDGFWYYYNQKSTDTANVKTPDFGDIVRFDYSIKTLNGEVIYAEGEKPTKEYAVDKEELFSGLRQGLKLMKEGETVTFLFPSHKAYGYYGDKNKIGTNVPIITKVTLHNIQEESKNETNN